MRPFRWMRIWINLIWTIKDFPFSSFFVCNELQQFTIWLRWEKWENSENVSMFEKPAMRVDFP